MSNITQNGANISDSELNSESESDSRSQFRVHLDNFSGPFDVLLSMISKRKLDVTQIALSQITDEFIAFVKELTNQSKDETKILDEISEFILIAATLLEIKSARLLPGQENFNAEDLALLEERDLLFAKLLQYKAYKDVALGIAEKFELGSGRHAHSMELEDKFKAVLPELSFNIDTRQLVLLAANAFTAEQYRNGGVSLEHIHMRQVNVAEQGIIISKRLMTRKSMDFSELIKDAKHAVVIIGRFLSLLELYKLNAVEFEQPNALSKLTIKWIAPKDFNPEDRLQGSDFDTPVSDAHSIRNHQAKGKISHKANKKGANSAKASN